MTAYITVAIDADDVTAAMHRDGEFLMEVVIWVVKAYMAVRLRDDFIAHFRGLYDYEQQELCEAFVAMAQAMTENLNEQVGQ